MKIVGRGDRVLLVGLAVALLVLFAGRATEVYIRVLIDFTRQVEQQSGLALVPALLILTVVFIVHQQGKRREAKAQAKAAAVDVVQAQAHSADMERLVAFGQALGRSLDTEAIRDVVQRHLPRLTGTDAAWVLAREGSAWYALLEPASSGSAEARQARQRVADRTLDAGGKPSTDPITVDGYLCLPLTAGGYSVGVLGLPEPDNPIAEGQRRILAAAAALLGVSIKNAQLYRDARENSVRDGLTGCFNRTHTLEALDTELRRARRSQKPLSLIMFDIDHFKNINDRHGHLCGDAVLAAVGAHMRTALRASDLKCRYGGEEFVVVLPETPLDGAKRVADTLRRELADMPVDWNGETLRITASFGVTTSQPDEADGQAIIGRADQAMYRAKEQGRNCVRLVDRNGGRLTSSYRAAAERRAVECRNALADWTEGEGHGAVGDDLAVDASLAREAAHPAPQPRDARFDFHDVARVHRPAVADALDAHEAG